MNFVDRLCRKWLSSSGYHVAMPIMQDLPVNLPGLYEYSTPQDFYRYLRPWTSRDFKTRLTKDVTENTLLPVIKLYILHAFANRAARQSGDFFEAGVYNGGSARLLLDVLRDHGASNQLWLLDTFNGYSTPLHNRDNFQFSEGDCRGQSKEYVQRLLADGANQVRLVEGAIPGTLAQVETQAIALAHIDVNLYEPTLAATEFCLDRLIPGGVIVFDDYGWPATFGARKAIEEACSKRSQVIISVPESSQAFVVSN